MLPRAARPVVLRVSPFDVKHRSRALTEGPERAAARAYLHGIGYSAEDLAKPIVGVAHSWIETMPCNFNNRVLAAKVKEGIRAAGGTPMELNTIAISDGITMGTAGMRASLVSRELIADSIELVASAHCFDALVCDLRLRQDDPRHGDGARAPGRPGLMLYGGSIRPGHYHGQDVTIQQVFEAVGEYAAGKITEEELHELEEVGLARSGGVRRPVHREHDGDGVRGARHLARRARRWCPRRTGASWRSRRQCGELVMDVLRRGLRPSEVITKRGPGERDRGGRDERRLDQRRAAPARGRAAKRACRCGSTSSTRSPSAPRCCATCSREAGTWPRTCTRRGASRSC